MYRRLSLTLVGLSLAVATAHASGWVDGADWSYNPASARVAVGDPIEGGASYDRIVIDIRRQSDDNTGTLRLDCVAREYAIWMLGVTPVDHPLSENAFASNLADEFCSRIETLPKAELMQPIDAP